MGWSDDTSTIYSNDSKSSIGSRLSSGLKSVGSGISTIGSKLREGIKGIGSGIKGIGKGIKRRLSRSSKSESPYSSPYSSSSTAIIPYTGSGSDLYSPFSGNLERRPSGSLWSPEESRSAASIERERRRRERRERQQKQEVGPLVVPPSRTPRSLSQKPPLPPSRTPESPYWDEGPPRPMQEESKPSIPPRPSTSPRPLIRLPERSVYSMPTHTSTFPIRPMQEESKPSISRPSFLGDITSGDPFSRLKSVKQPVVPVVRSSRPSFLSDIGSGAASRLKPVSRPSLQPLPLGSLMQDTMQKRRKFLEEEELEPDDSSWLDFGHKRKKHRKHRKFGHRNKRSKKNK